MPETFPFWFTFCTTVVLLGISLVTGWRRLRKAHLWFGPLTMISLTITVVLTEELARQYEFPADIKATHMIFAKTGGLLALPVIVTGIWLWRQERARKWHLAAVLLWLVSVLVATGTGLWMFSQGTLRAG